MIVKDKISRVPKWSKSSVNRWADYIELMCLYGDDHLISKDDVLDILVEGGAEEFKRGEADYSDKYDKIVSVIENYYEIIEYRNSKHKSYYPFDVEDGQCIILKERLSKKHMHYIFLLLCSSICFMDQSSLQKITHVFEKYCYPIMKVLMPPDAQTELLE